MVLGLCIFSDWLKLTNQLGGGGAKPCDSCDGGRLKWDEDGGGVGDDGVLHSLEDWCSSS